MDHHIADSADFTVNAAEKDLIDRFQRLTERLRQAESHYGRAEGSVCLVAVSKTYPADNIRTVATQGQRDFGENQIQDAMTKIPVLTDLGCSWHFIGPIQSNKCRDIALHFDWVHSVDRAKVARRLSDMRPADAEPINMFIQVNLQNEATNLEFCPSSSGYSLTR